MSSAVQDRTGGAAFGDIEWMAGLPAQGDDPHTQLLDVMNPSVRAALQRFDDVSFDGFLVLTRLFPFFRTDSLAETDVGSLDRRPDVVTVDATGRIATVADVKGSERLPVDSRRVIDAIAHVLSISNQHRTLIYDVVVRSSASVGTTGRDTVTARVSLGAASDAADDHAPAIDVTGAVTTVRALADLFGVPVGDILKASGISKSSFHSWDKPSRPKPRLSSQGALWAFAEVANELAEVVPGTVADWMRADTSRRALLRVGDFDALYAQVFERPFERGEGVAPTYALTAGVHDEPEGPLVELPPARRTARLGKRARVARKAVRRTRRDDTP